MRLVIPAKAGIQLIEYYPAKRDSMAVLSASQNVILLDSRLRGNDGLDSRRSLPSNGVVGGGNDGANEQSGLKAEQPATEQAAKPNKGNKK